METFIKKISETFKQSLQAVIDYGVTNSYSFDIDCTTLNDYNNVDIRQANEYKTIFSELEKLQGPVLYWFEIISQNSPKEIRDTIVAYKNTENKKATPALKTRFDNNSKCLYVGKVKRAFWGRVIQYLGFYKVNATQGLQLFYWGKSINLRVRVHAYEFQPNMVELISIYETELAKKLNPIIGKH